MAYRTILVYAQNEDRAANIIEVAATLAKKSDNVHLIGLYVLPGMPVYSGVDMGVSFDIDDVYRQGRMDQAERIQKIFDKISARDGISAEWRVDESNVVNVEGKLIDHSHCCDLIVIGQQEGGELTFDQQELPGRLLVESGRPVLLIPHSGTFKTVGNNVLLAWNSSRESVRATFDALPLLKRAGKVCILSINQPESDPSHSTILGTEIAASLARHGVNAEVVKDLASDISVGDEVLSRAFAHECDLIVMGAYGHSRLREMVFGGATKYVLNHMTMPVLMSH